MDRKLSILIPCYNEEAGIGGVLSSIPYEKLERLDYDVETIVIDNNSTDKTVELALFYDVKVIAENRQGKGHAVLKGFKNISKESDIVIMIDGDNTYDAKEIIRMIEPIESKFCDVVIGSRLNGKMAKDSMSFFNRFGNWLFTFMVRVGYKANITDVCSGYFAWKKEVLDKVIDKIESKGFSFEMEMIVKLARMDITMFCVPISYELRKGESSLKPIGDGIRIFNAWIKYLFWTPATAKRTNQRKTRSFPMQAKHLEKQKN